MGSPDVGDAGAVTALLDQLPAGQGALPLGGLALRNVVAFGLIWLVDPGRRRFPRLT